ncbi:non-ribosomal peptide synthetase [Paenibacillus harenae]|uniref:non-ribosomal peptide synthetase n=1 Tax=Paenibacillus harenae TaxID=306543 RepID=UPI00042970E6|nr:non-ribosomal peptide synthetase [Paenibacillus harenae]
MIDKRAQQMLLAGGRYDKEQQYWADKLQDDIGMSELPRMMMRGGLASAAKEAGSSTYSFGIHRHVVDEAAAGKLRAAASTGYGLFMLLLSGVSYLVHHYTSAGQARIGVPVFKQHKELKEPVNQLLVIHTELKGDYTFRDWAGHVRQAVTEANEHQNIPFHTLAEYAQIALSEDGTAELPTLVMLDGVHDRSYAEKINTSLAFVFSMEEDRLEVAIEYDLHRYSEQSIQSLAVHLSQVLRAIETPDEPLSRLSLLTEEERNLLLNTFNDTSIDLPQGRTLHALFEEQAHRSPERTAVQFGGERLTYRELNARANQLARTLRARGAAADTVVAVLSERSNEMIVALLAVLKAGAAYLPVDPAYPQERRAYLLQDSRANLVLAQTRLLAESGSVQTLDLGDAASYDADDSDLAALAGPEHMAYLIYTSGTTGQPKGVAVEHRGVANSIQWRAAEYGLTEQDVVLQLFSFSFDGFVTSFFTPIVAGASVVLVSEEEAKDPLAIRRLITAEGVTHFISVPSLYGVIIDGMKPEDAVSLRIVTLAGERIPDSLLEKSRRIAPQTELVNEYGPTETSVVATICRQLQADEAVTIGSPIANTSIYIVNEHLQLMPVGVPGELCIAGAGLARGYWMRPELTAEKFVNCPYLQGQRMYRTGDLARWLPDGRIEYLDRIDHQVKIRGYRIELGEIEAAVLSQPSVEEAVVIALDDADGQKTLCAYLTAEDELALLDIKERLASELPSYMVPAHFVQLAYMPRLPSGKLDRKALPEPDFTASVPGDAAGYFPPSNETEQKLCTMWQELLALPVIGTKDHFFKKGGHSLKAMTMISQIHQTFGVEVPLRVIFESPVIEAISAYIIGQRESGLGHSYSDIEAVTPRAYYPVSSAQKRMYVVSTLAGSGTSYNLPGFILIEGELDVPRLQGAFHQLVNRHETLRTRFETVDGEPVQIVEELAELDVPYSEADESETERLTEAFVRPFELNTAPLFRAELVKLKEHKHLLMYDMHHIISDGVSAGIIVKEFVELYQGSDLEPLRVQYKDYAVWQQERLGSAQLKTQEHYWLNRFSDELPVLDLPTDFPRPPVQSFHGGVVTQQADRSLLDLLQALAKQTDTTLYMVLLAAYNVMLAKYSGKEDIIIGSPTAGRQHADTEPMIGMFVGTLVMRNRPEADKTFASFLQEVKESTLEAFDHQGYPFESLIEKLGLQRDISRNPLFDTMFIVQNMDLEAAGLSGLSFIPLNSEARVSKFDLSLQAREAEEGLLLSAEYSSALYKEETVQRMLGHFIEILKCIAARPDRSIRDIEMITEGEKQVILRVFNDTRTAYPRDASIAELFRNQAQLTPEHAAVTYCGRIMSYRELNACANRIARKLQEDGIGRGDTVAVYADRSLALIVGVLGILKAGAAFVTLDPLFPEERIRFMLEDSAASACLTFGTEPITSTSLTINWIDLTRWLSSESAEEDDLHVAIAPDDLAYIMYTSGSTGNPKGVMVEQRNVVRLVKGTNYASFDPDGCLLLTGSVGFDAITFEIFGALLNGLTLHIVDKDVLLHTEHLAAYIHEHRITLMWLTAPLFNQLSEERPDMFAGVRQLIIGGDVLSPRHINRVRRGTQGITLINGYGPTENTTFSTTYAIDTDFEDSIPIGRPISNSTAYIMNEAGHLQPVGVPGELVVGGDGVSRGYANLPEMSAEKFVPNPYEHGERMYRTGDLARWRADGMIEYLGRIDQQVKIRGYRIELHEIETGLLKQPGMKEACVVAGEDLNGQKALCAYYVSEANLEVSELRAALAQQLPAYMIPLCFIQLERFPLTANGKIDRRVLPKPDFTAAAALSAGYVSPRTATESQLAALWEEALGIRPVGVTDDFFALGGHSLKAMTLIARMKRRFGVDVPLRKLFEAATIEALAVYIDHADKAVQAAVGKAPEQPHYPLTPAQERLFVLSRFEGAGISYNLPRVMTIDGPLEWEHLQLVFRKLVTRHEALRTSFVLVDGEPVQRIAPDDDIHFEVIRRQAEEAELTQLVDAFIRPFDLEKAPLLRVELIELSAEKHVMMCDMHHIIADGVSMSLFMKEFAELYEGAELPALRISYKDFAVWLNSGEGKSALKLQEQYWLEAFAEEAPLLALPTDYPRPAVQSFKGANHAVQAGGALKNALNEAAAKTGTTLYMVLLAAYNVLLHKYSGQTDIVVGTPVAGRPHADVEPIIGMFVNTLALRSYPESSKTFGQLLEEVKQSALAALDNQHYPFNTLVEKLNLPRDLSRNPLFDTMFSLQNIDMDTRELTGLRIEPFHFEGGAAKFDLSLEATETEDELIISFEYGTALFKRETIERMGDHFLHILKEIAANPHLPIAEIDMMSVEEKSQLTERFNDTAAEFPAETTIHEVFEAQADKTPDAVAVMDGSRTFTYRELNAQANRLAHKLRASGVGPDRIVPLMLERAAEMIIGILAIHKAGGAYLPVDPDFPEERIRYMLEDSGAEWLLTQTRFVAKAHSLPVGEMIDLDDPAAYADREAGNLQPIAGPSHLAYVIYTSGSTGKPKGVMIEHRAAINRIHWMQKAYPINENDVILQKTPYTFDVSVWEMFWWGFTGAKVCFLKPGGEKDPEEIVQAIERSRITTLHFVPSMLSIFLDYIARGSHAERLSSLRLLFASGEALQPGQVSRFHSELYSRHGAKLINLYGPTEAAVDVSHFDCSTSDRSGIVPIGKPIDNIQLYVVNGDFRLQPVGIPGELCIAGVGLARGYVNKPELTAEKFVDHPFTPGTKMYRTGDLARWLPDGNMEYLGRLDFQVKIRGYRIELGEIETVLLKHEAVRDTVVAALQDKEKLSFLCAYFTADRELNVNELRGHIGSSLPAYMIPAQFVQLESLPLSPNGKINRKALPEPEGQLATGAAYIAPRTPTEELLVGLWREALGIERIGVLDSFFALGGHSLKAMALLAQMHKACGVEVPLRYLFEWPTIEAAARYIDEYAEQTYSPIRPAPKQELYAVSSAQKRMYILDLFEGKGTSLAYNMPAVIGFEGIMDEARFEQALQRLVSRHEPLRTSFHQANGEPLQRVHDKVDMYLERHQASTEEEAGQLIEEWFRPFDLAEAPLLRAALFRISEQKHVFAYDMHHIVSDGVSGSIFLQELIQLYEGEDLPAPALHYKDFALWQNEWLESEAFVKQEQFWLNQFAGGDVPLLELPADYARRAVKSFSGAVVAFEANTELAHRLEGLAQDSRATLYMVLLAAYKVLLSRYSGQTDIVVGAPIAGRSHADTAGMLGMFVNSLAMRSSLSAERTFREFLSDVKQNALDAFEHQDYPFEMLVEKLQLPRDLSRNPLFDTVVVWQNAGSERSDAAEAPHSQSELRIVPFGQEHSISKFDLSLIAAPGEGTLRLSFEYCTDLFREETINSMAGHFLRILEAAAYFPDSVIGQIDLITNEEKRWLSENNATEREYAGSNLLHGLFEEQASRLPAQPAIVQGESSLTYSKLNARANQLARTIRSYGVQSGDIVAISADRSLDMAVGMLAVMKAGAAYLPVDPDYPADRIRYLLKDSRTPLLLARASAIQAADYEFSGSILNLESEDSYDADDSNPEWTVLPQDLAYVIYTSGTTGEPKGVMIEHQSIANSVKWRRAEFGFGPEDKALQIMSFAFDASVSSLFTPLASGAVSYLVPKEEAKDPAALKKYVSDLKITHLNCVSSLFGTIIHLLEPDEAVSLRQITLGGEPVSGGLVEQTKRKNAKVELINEYGPTESSVMSTYMRGLDPDRSITIGKPIANTKIYIVNDRMQQQPVGVRGELCIAGIGLSRGYWNQQELTEEKFVPCPFVPGERMYRTGDAARWLPDGMIEFAGRIDRQVKVRGYRIELAEIDAVLLKLPAVREASVQALNDAGGENYLCAYLVVDDEETVHAAKAAAIKELPAYMVPAYFIRLKKLPLTPNGKIDLKALPLPDVNALREPYTAPRNEEEQKLAQIWEELLGIPQAGIHDNFFEVGGNSLKAAMLTVKVYERLRVELPFLAVFQQPTIAELAGFIARRRIQRSEEQPITLLNGPAERHLFCFPPIAGYGFVYQKLGALLEEAGIAVYGFDFIHEDDQIEQYVKYIRGVQPEGPYLLLGYSAGGNLAFNVARMLEAEGSSVSDLIMLDAEPKKKAIKQTARQTEEKVGEIIDQEAAGTQYGAYLQNGMIRDTIYRHIVAYMSFLNKLDNKGKLAADIHFIESEGKELSLLQRQLDWSKHTTGRHLKYKGAGTHEDMLEPAYITANAELIRQLLR